MGPTHLPCLGWPKGHALLLLHMTLISVLLPANAFEFEKPLYEASVAEGPTNFSAIVQVAVSPRKENVRYGMTSLVDARSQKFFSIDEATCEKKI